MGSNIYIVKSPVMGTFYRASAPGGIVKKFLVEDEEPVMKNQELIEIEIG
jgi:biotin carboxyl carrier protein